MSVRLIQELHAGISRRDWSAVESASNRLRDEVYLPSGSMESSTLRTMLKVPDGWKLVPEIPTPDMVGSWYRYKSGVRFIGEEPARDTSDYGAYAAMLAVSPSYFCDDEGCEHHGTPHVCNPQTASPVAPNVDEYAADAMLAARSAKNGIGG